MSDAIEQEMFEHCWRSTGFKRLSELLKAHPEVNINRTKWRSSGYNEETMLHNTCVRDLKEATEALLSRADIDPNIRDKHGSTPLMKCFYHDALKCFQLLVRDRRVDINKTNGRGMTPLMMICRMKNINFLGIMLASGRYLNLEYKSGKHPKPPVDPHKTALDIAKEHYWAEGAAQLEAFEKDPEPMIKFWLKKLANLNLVEERNVRCFVLVVSLCDGYYKIKTPRSKNVSIRFFRIAQRLPMEIQAILCNRLFRVASDTIHATDFNKMLAQMAREKIV